MNATCPGCPNFVPMSFVFVPVPPPPLKGGGAGWDNLD
jgi:hypothetical protein